MVASEFISAEDRAAISNAVAEAERRTTGEIVPVLATESDRYERAEDTFGLWLALVAVTVAWLGFQGYTTAEWTGERQLSVELLTLLVVIVGAWIVGIILARRIPFLKRLAAGRGVMQVRVEEAAQEAFDRLHVRGTKASTGIVLYVSLFEHVVAVIGDRAISEKVPPAEWKAICESMTRALRAGKPREGWVEAIRKCGELLAVHFPAQTGDLNELTNELRVID